MRPRKLELKIVGRLNGTFEELHAAGCIQTGADVHPDLADALKNFGSMFLMLLGLCGNNPCDGCPNAGAFTFKHDRPTRIDEVECKAFQAYHSMALSDATTRRTRLEAATSPPGTNMYPGMSVAQIAKELGVSKSEVRRRKQAGLI